MRWLRMAWPGIWRANQAIAYVNFNYMKSPALCTQTHFACLSWYWLNAQHPDKSFWPDRRPQTANTVTARFVHSANALGGCGSARPHLGGYPQVSH